MTDITTPAESAPQSGNEGTTEPELVAVEDASDDELQSFLSSYKESDGDSSESDSSDKDDSSDESTSAQGKEDEAEDESGGTPRETEDPPLTRAEVERLLKENSELKARTNQQEQFIQRRSNELGEVRKELRTVRAQLETALKEHTDQGDVAGALDAREQIKKVDDALKEVDTEQQTIQHVSTTAKYVTERVNLNEIPVDDVIEALKEQGADDQYIDGFIKNPWAHAQGDALVQFFKGVKYRSALSNMLQINKVLMSKLEEAKGKPERVVQKIKEAANVSRHMNGSSGSPGGKRFSADTDLSALSDDELTALAKQHGIDRAL